MPFVECTCDEGVIECGHNPRLCDNEDCDGRCKVPCPTCTGEGYVPVTEAELLEPQYRDRLRF